MSYTVVRWLYNFIYILLLPGVFLRLWLRGRRLPAYRLRWSERVGGLPFPPLENVLWIHAVSVGEVMSVIPLVKTLRSNTNLPILFTTTTPTGSARLEAAFKDQLGNNFYHCYFPFDINFIWARFFKRIQPKCVVLMETEIWPNLLHHCQEKNIPVIIANARLSPTSCTRYAKISSWMQTMLAPVQLVLTQSEQDSKNFAKMGIPKDKIMTTGNIKYDLNLPAYLEQEAQNLRKHLGESRFVLIAASTHEGEEAIILNAVKALKQSIPNLLCLLVPRHPDRFKQVEQLCVSENLVLAKRSQMDIVSEQTDIFLGDTMGEMLLFYAASDIAFVGGSFTPIGGHNLLEPASLGLPILTGPHLFNFTAISQQLFSSEAALLVQNEQDFISTVQDLFQQPLKAARLGENAKQVVEKNKGALSRQLEAIGRFI